MSTDKVRSSKLKFKGEKIKKKRKREDAEDEAGGSSRRRREEDDKDPETWVLPENPNEIRGPTYVTLTVVTIDMTYMIELSRFIIHPSDPSPICVNFDSTRNHIVLHVLDKDIKAEDAETPSLLDRTPTEVSQVWVTTRVAGSPTVNLRTGTGEGKFLSCDAHGLVSADREARGPQEEWTPVILPDGMTAFMNVYEKYLGVDEIAGGNLSLRGDSDEVGFGERFWVKVQSKYKKEATLEERKKTDGLHDATKIDETSTK